MFNVSHTPQKNEAFRRESDEHYCKNCFILGCNKAQNNTKKYSITVHWNLTKFYIVTLIIEKSYMTL